jgi:hypothetical protein
MDDARDKHHALAGVAGVSWFVGRYLRMHGAPPTQPFSGRERALDEHMLIERTQSRGFAGKIAMFGAQIHGSRLTRGNCWGLAGKLRKWRRIRDGFREGRSHIQTCGEF